MRERERERLGKRERGSETETHREERERERESELVSSAGIRDCHCNQLRDYKSSQGIPADALAVTFVTSGRGQDCSSNRK